MSKRNASIPKTGVEDWRREAYDQALEICRQADPDLSFSDWIRQACDAKAEQDIGWPVNPPRRRIVAGRKRRKESS